MIVMSTTPEHSPQQTGAPVSASAIEFDEALEALGGALDRLAAVDRTGMTDVEVEDRLRRYVTESRRAPVVTNAMVAEAMGRCLPVLRRCSSTAAYLRNLIRVTAGEGKALERDAIDLVPRRSLTTGEVLPPRHPAVAAAIELGVISTAHARLITDTLRQAPAAVPAHAVARAEVKLVRSATRHDPNTLRRRCEEELDRLDPDGSLGNHTEHHDRVRWLRLGNPNKHGMVPIRGLLRPDTAAKVIAALSPLAAPQPTRDAPDLRSPEQRDHDALDALAQMALASDNLPNRHGFPGKLLITARLADLENRTGFATTIHGGKIPIRDLLRMGADLGVIPVVFDTDGQLLHFGEEQRLGTLAQRCAYWLLDGGCTFENCTIPAIWCQGAHGEDFLSSRRTSIDDLGPLCGYHHRLVDNQGWTMRRVNNRIWITPPKWIDPDQTPRTNEHFRPLQE